MRFARVTAAAIVLILVLPLLNRLPREAYVLFAPGPAALARWGDGALYTVAWLAFYVLLLCAFWGGRKALVAMDLWQTSGLTSLDLGIHSSWPPRLGFILGTAVIASVAIAGGADRVPAVAEAVVAAVAVFVAVTGKPAEPNRIDPYDPLPAGPSPSPVPTPEPPAPSSDTGETIPLKLTWYFHRDPGNMAATQAAFEVQIAASKACYEELRQRDHTVKVVQDFTRFVRDGMTPEVDAVSHQIRQQSQTAALGAIGEINNVLAFAQRFAYIHDDVDKGVGEYPKFPIETLVEDRGDCEDHAILAAACLARLGYDVRLVALPQHVALAVAGPDDLPGAFFIKDPSSGRKFYYCEVSANAASRDPKAVTFRMGELPDDTRRGGMQLLAIA